LNNRVELRTFLGEEKGRGIYNWGNAREIETDFFQKSVNRQQLRKDIYIVRKAGERVHEKK